MRIAMIHTPLVGPSGGERQILELAYRLEKRGHEVTIFTNGVDEEKCYPDLIKKVNIEVVRYPVNIKYLKTYLGMKKIGKVIGERAKEFDLINNHNFPSEWAVYYAKKNCDLPAVWMCNEPPFWFFVPEARKGIINKLRWPFYEILDKKSVEKINEIVVLSGMIQKLVKKIYKRNSIVVRSGIDLKKFEIRRDSREYKNKETITILMVGMLAPHKKQDTLIKTIHHIKNKNKNIYKKINLIFAGPEIEEFKNYLFSLIKKFNLSANIEFKGAVSDTELLNLYASCDIFVFPAHQSWSLVTVEAMAMGKPVIVSNKCGVSEIIENRKTGFIFKHDNYKELAEKIVELIENEELRIKMGKNARKYVKENLSWEKYAENMEKVFMKVLENENKKS